MAINIHSVILAVKMAFKKSKDYTDQKTSGISGGINYKGSVSYYSSLPNNPEDGDAYTVKYAGDSGTTPDGTEYVWGYDTDLQTMAWIDFSKDSYTKAQTDAIINPINEQVELNKNNISLLETKVNTNVSIISQTYNSTDCNISLILIQDSTEDLYVHYDTEARKLYMPYKVIKNQYKYWKDGVAYYKYHVLTEGVIMTNNSAKCNMLTSDTPEIANETYKRSWVATDDGGSAVTTAFNLSKANSEIGDVWYNRPYIIYDDLETGMRYKMYGPVYKITVGTPCTIECDTLSCTELTAAIRAIQVLLANQ